MGIAIASWDKRETLRVTRGQRQAERPEGITMWQIGGAFPAVVVEALFINVRQPIGFLFLDPS